MSFDLPCRLIFVIGSASGGTSATAGTLNKNGFWMKDPSAYFENKEGGKIISRVCAGDSWVSKGDRSFFGKPNLEITDYIKYLTAIDFYEYKKAALQAGQDKAVLKVPGRGVWVPELFIDLPLGVKVEPLLVYRDPVSTAKSLNRRWPDIKDAYRKAEELQNAILKLHADYGWPLWEFGKSGTVKDLEAAVGVKLPREHFRPEDVRN